MKQISGNVLVKETNSGVPNLVVTAYDSEKSIQEIIAGDPARTDLILKELGKRIGSVLTDQEGKFILRIEDLEFQRDESRPDLLIIIFAPEDIQNLDAPYPLPPEKRVLYISAAPRKDAGTEEAYVIRLLQAQLDHFHVSTRGSTRQSETDSYRLASAVESTWNFQDNIRERLKPRLLEEQKKSEKIKEMAEEKVKDFSAIPLYLRDGEFKNNRLLINGKKDLVENLKVKQDQAIEEGLQRFQTRQSILHLMLTRKDLKDLGLTESDGEINGEVDSEKLAEKLGSLIKGFDLVRLRGLNNPSPEELEQKYLAEAPAPAKNKTAPRGS